MPRGNLEGIYPRIVMLKQVIEEIEATEYGKAFKLLRQHKIDINLIHDVNPAKFLSNIGKFVSEVKQVDHLNLFINSLNEDERGKELDFMRPLNQEDQIRAKHQGYISHDINGEPLNGEVSSKVNSICEAIKKELWALNQ